MEKSLSGDEEAQKRYDWIIIEMLDQMVRHYSGGEMLEYWQHNPMPAEDFVAERCGAEILINQAQMRDPANTSVLPKSDHLMNLKKEKRGPLKVGQFRLSGEVHQWMYDRYSLKSLLKNVGFRRVRLCRANESSIPNFNAYLLDIAFDGSVHKPDSLFMEGRK